MATVARQTKDRALVLVAPPGLVDDQGDSRLAWLEEQVHELVAPNGRRSLRVRNRAHFPARTPLATDDRRAAEGVLRDAEAVLRVVGFLVGVPPAPAPLFLGHAAS